MEAITSQIFNKCNLVGIIEQAIALKSTFPEIQINHCRGVVRIIDVKAFERNTSQHRYYLYHENDPGDPDESIIAAIHRDVGTFVMTAVVVQPGILDRSDYGDYGDIKPEGNTACITASLWTISVNGSKDPLDALQKLLGFMPLRESGLSFDWYRMLPFSEAVGIMPAELHRTVYSANVTLLHSSCRIPDEANLLEVLGIGKTFDAVDVNGRQERVTVVVRSTNRRALYRIEIETTSALESLLLYDDINYPRRMSVTIVRLGIDKPSSKIDGWVHDAANEIAARANQAYVESTRPEPEKVEEVSVTESGSSLKLIRIAAFPTNLREFFMEIQKEHGIEEYHALEFCEALSKLHVCADHDLRTAINNFVQPNFFTRIALWWRGA